MTEQTTPSAEQAISSRVVEFEFRMPKAPEVKMPEVDWEPVRKVAQDVLYGTLGIGVLIGRGIVKIATKARDAGQDAVENPGPVTQAMLELFKRKEKQDAEASAFSIPILPLADYDTLSIDEISVALANLSAGDLATLLAYEQANANRDAVIAAIQAKQ